MVSRVPKEDKENFPVGIIVIAVIFGLILLYGIFGSNSDNSSDNYPQKTYQPPSAVQKNIEEPKDNRPLCPDGNKADSGQKTEDWFSCSDVKDIISSNKNKQEIDCSVSKNYNIARPAVLPSYGCLYPDNKVYFGADEFCLMQGNTLVPNIRYESYPSINEYLLKRFAVEIKNNGCTKINRSSIFLFYSLYQNERLLAWKKSNIVEEQYYAEKRLAELNKDWYDFDEEKEMFIYPTNSDIYWLDFSDKDWISERIRSDPYKFTLKICLVDKESSIPIDCEKISFDMVYEGLKE